MHLKENISLKPYNTFGIEAKAAFFSAFRSIEELSKVLEIAKKRLLVTGTLVLGGGSNILLTQNINGLVLKNEIDGIEKLHESEDNILIQAGGGVNWHKFVLYCLKNNYAGVENLALIPGSVGASPMQNIGAYGVELKDVFHSLEAYHVKEGYIKTFNKEDCRFGYRESIFKNQIKNEFIITSVNFLLSKKPVFKTSYGAIEKELELMGTTTLSIHAIAQAVIQIRKSKLPDPDVIGNAGSFFKNPTIPAELYNDLQQKFPMLSGYKIDDKYKIPAGWLIEQCGWKGYRKGNAGCHELQALVLVNFGGATGQEILDLSTTIINDVHEKFYILLEREVNII